MNIEILAEGSAGDKKFDVPDFLPNSPFFMSVVGMRGSGKSLLVMNLLNQFYLKCHDYFVLCCPTYKANGDYDWLIERHNPNHYFFDNLGEFKDIVNKLVARNREIILDKENHEREHAPNILLVLDDCAYHRSITGNYGILNELAMNGRHYKVSTIVISQVLSSISRIARVNSEMLILFPCVNQSEVEQFLEQYVSKSKVKSLKREIERIFEIPYNFISVKRKVVNNKLTAGLTEGVEFKDIVLTNER